MFVLIKFSIVPLSININSTIESSSSGKLIIVFFNVYNAKFFFFIPFIGLIPKISKWTPIITIPICIVVLSAQWVTFLWFVIPELVGAGEWGFPWLELGTFFGFLGAFLYSFYLFASKNPMLSIADPLLPASYNHH